MILLCDFNLDYCFILIWIVLGILFSEMKFFFNNNLFISMLIKLNYSNYFMISSVILVILDIV